MMKFRKWEDSDNRGRFRYIEKTLNLSCSAYNPVDLPDEDYSEEKWEQSAGAVDKKGKEIYQGDIATSAWGIGQVIKTENGFEFETNDKRDALWKATVGDIGRKFEIVGNIHQHPDLIPKKFGS